MSDITIRCGKCDAIIPPENVDADTAIVVCRECGAIRRLVELMRFPVPRNSRYTYQREGDTIVVRKHATWEHLSAALFFVAISLLFFFNALLMLAVEGEGLTIWSIGFFGFSILFLWVILLSVDRRTIRITPEKCQITRNPLGIPVTEEIPRNDVSKAVRQHTILNFMGRETIRLDCNCGFINLGTVAAGYDSVLLGAINHYLYTVPPADMTPRTNRMTLGGKVSDTQEVKPYCPDCGHVICTENFVLASLRGKCDQCGREFSLSESPTMAYSDASWPNTGHLSYEKEDGRLRIEWREKPSIALTREAAPVVMGLLVGRWFGFFTMENIPFLVLVGILVILWCWMLLLKLTVRWTIDFDAEKLEISYRCLFFSGTQTIPRSKIAVFSLYDQDELWINRLNPSFCPQSMVIAERNDGHRSLRVPALRMPGFSREPNIPQSVWLMNELNDFLMSKGHQNRTNHQYRGPSKSLFDANWIPPSRRWET